MSTMHFDFNKDKTSIIKVIGVGGGGSNAVNHMFRQGIKGVEFMVCNTDAQALDMSPVPIKIKLGETLTEGRGAGSIPEVGRNAALENINDIRKLLEPGTKMVFITAGMGGGTGTGAAPIIAQTAKEMGILTVGIVTVPFGFEGRKRKNQADDGLEQLRKSVDTLLIICNDKLREIHGNLKLSEAFGRADDILTIAAKGIAEIITVTGYINVDFEDVRTVMKDSGVAIMGSATAEGEDRAIRAIEQALNSPLLNDTNIHGARHILLNVASGNVEVRMDEIDTITDFIQQQAGLTAELIWGNCVDEGLGDKISVTIIATGFKTREELGTFKPETKRVVLKLDDQEQKTIVPVSEETQTKVPETEMQNEPTLIRKEEDQKISIEFKIENATIENQVIPESTGQQNEPTMLEPVLKAVPKPEFDEQVEKSRERIMRLRELSIKLGNPAKVGDMEREPAYKRRNVDLDPVPHSSESKLSRYSLSEDADKKAEIKPNNSFLHDNVD